MEQRLEGKKQNQPLQCLKWQFAFGWNSCLSFNIKRSSQKEISIANITSQRELREDSVKDKF